jgi:hypothetical protein
MPNNRCLECQESPCACDLDEPCPHGVPRLFLGDCEPCSDAQHERHLRADGWCPASERDEARAALVNAVERLDYLSTEDTHANREAYRLREAHPIVAELMAASKGIDA